MVQGTGEHKEFLEKNKIMGTAEGRRNLARIKRFSLG
jgi:hypothetical protein